MTKTCFFFAFFFYKTIRLLLATYCTETYTSHNAIQYLCCLQYDTYCVQHIAYTTYNVLNTLGLRYLHYLHAIQNTAIFSRTDISLQPSSYLRQSSHGWTKKTLKELPVSGDLGGVMYCVYAEKTGENSEIE